MMFPFDKTYVINLPHRTDRIRQCNLQADKYEFKYEVLPAVSAADFKAQYECTNNGANGCSASHILAFHRAEILGLSSYLILEDDFEINPEISRHLAACLLDLPKDWDILYFGASHREAPDRVTDLIYKVNKSFTTHAYAVNMSGRFGQMIEDFDFSTAIDAWIAVKQKDYNCYVTNPPLIWQRADHSDIEGRVMDYPWIKQPL